MRRMRHLKPREIQGCQLALDASIPVSLYDATSGGNLVAANGAVARWEDQSGNGYHVTQSTSGNQPLRRVAQKSGLDAIQFDSSNDRMINASISVSIPTTIFAFGQSSKSSAAYIDSYNNSQHALYRGGGGDLGGNHVFAARGGVGNYPVFAFDSDWGGLIGIATASSGCELLRGRAYGANASNATTGLNGVSVGNLRGNPSPIVAYPLGGYLAEIAVFNTSLSLSVARRLNDSRSRKWRTDR